MDWDGSGIGMDGWIKWDGIDFMIIEIEARK